MFGEPVPKTADNNNVILFGNKLDELLELFTNQNRQDEREIIHKFKSRYYEALNYGMENSNMGKIAIYGGYEGISPNLNVDKMPSISDESKDIIRESLSSVPGVSFEEEKNKDGSEVVSIVWNDNFRREADVLQKERNTPS